MTARKGEPLEMRRRTLRKEQRERSDAEEEREVEYEERQRERKRKREIDGERKRRQRDERSVVQLTRFRLVSSFFLSLPLFCLCLPLYRKSLNAQSLRAPVVLMLPCGGFLLKRREKGMRHTHPTPFSILCLFVCLSFPPSLFCCLCSSPPLCPLCSALFLSICLYL